ncbi:hypothetical protein [Microbulbifer discodermiae]|uniref:hypothetical protein n=1 Tax=Microbulbifer sp. 2201CG32-9 TaxID=3232309 RepID=UPI00345BA8FE
MKKFVCSFLFFCSFDVYSSAGENALQDLFESLCQSRSYHYAKHFSIQSVYITIINSSDSVLPDKRIYFSNGDSLYYQLPSASSLPMKDQSDSYVNLISTVYNSLASSGTVDLCYDYRTSPFTVVDIYYNLG